MALAFEGKIGMFQKKIFHKDDKVLLRMKNSRKNRKGGVFKQNTLLESNELHIKSPIYFIMPLLTFHLHLKGNSSTINVIRKIPLNNSSVA